MNALPVPCEITIAKAISPSSAATRAGGVRATTDSSVRSRND